MAAEENTNSTLTSNQVVVKQSKGEHKLIKLLSDVVQGSSSTEDGQLCITPYQKASIEVSRYSREVTTEVGTVYWYNLSKYPILSRLSIKHLCIQATSVSTERAFSCAGSQAFMSFTRVCRNAYLSCCKPPAH